MATPAAHDHAPAPAQTAEEACEARQGEGPAKGAPLDPGDEQRACQVAQGEGVDQVVVGVGRAERLVDVGQQRDPADGVERQKGDERETDESVRE